MVALPSTFNDKPRFRPLFGYLCEADEDQEAIELLIGRGKYQTRLGGASDNDLKVWVLHPVYRAPMDDRSSGSGTADPTLAYLYQGDGTASQEASTIHLHVQALQELRLSWTRYGRQVLI